MSKIKGSDRLSRNDIIELVKNLAGPVGPFTSIQSMEDLDKLRVNKYSIVNINSIDILIDIILNPPKEKELGQVTLEDFEFELVEMLTFIGRMNISSFLKKVSELLYIEQSRPVIIDVLGGLRHEESMLLLEQLLLEDLNESEVIRLANALNENGGIKAKEILEKMKVKYSISSEEILKEIEICLTTLKY